MKLRVSNSTESSKLLYFTGCKEWIKDNPYWYLEFILEDEDGLVYLEKPSIDYRGKTRVLTRHNKVSYKAHLPSELKNGYYKPTEVSEDLIVFKRVEEKE